MGFDINSFAFFHSHITILTRYESYVSKNESIDERENWKSKNSRKEPYIKSFNTWSKMIQTFA